MNLSIEIKSIGPEFIQQVLGLAALCEQNGWKIKNGVAAPASGQSGQKRKYKVRKPSAARAGQGVEPMPKQADAILEVLKTMGPSARMNIVTQARNWLRVRGVKAAATAIASQISKMRASGVVIRQDDGLFALGK